MAEIKVELHRNCLAFLNPFFALDRRLIEDPSGGWRKCSNERRMRRLKFFYEDTAESRIEQAINDDV